MQKDETVKCQMNQLIDKQAIMNSVRLSVFVFLQNPFFMIEKGFRESFSEEQKKEITPILANLTKLDLFVTELHYVIMNIHLRDVSHDWRCVLFYLFILQNTCIIDCRFIIMHFPFSISVSK